MYGKLKIITGSKIELLHSKKVVLIGLGGVGSMAFNSLIRCGVLNIKIVDYDVVDVTNLNRQLYLKSDIGLYKTDVMKKYAAEVGEYNIDTLKEKLTIDNMESIINDAEYVIDAMDDVSMKLELIRTCKKRKIKLISCMGTCNRTDPSKLKIDLLRNTFNDPLSRKLRERLNNSNAKVVFSTELPLIREELGSNCLVPTSAGVLLASYVVNDIVGKL